MKIHIGYTMDTSTRGGHTSWKKPRSYIRHLFKIAFYAQREDNISSLLLLWFHWLLFSVRINLRNAKTIFLMLSWTSKKMRRALFFFSIAYTQTLCWAEFVQKVSSSKENVSVSMAKKVKIYLSDSFHFRSIAKRDKNERIGAKSVIISVRKKTNLRPRDAIS